MRRVRLTAGVLLGMLPVLLVAAHNASQLTPSQLLRPLGVVAAATLLVQAVLWVWLRQADRAAFLAGGLVCTLQLWGHVLSRLVAVGMADDAARVVASVVLVAVWGALLLGALRSRRHGDVEARRAHAWFVLTLLFVLVPLLQVAWDTSRALRTVPQGNQPTPALEAAAARPDIVFLLLDGYGRSDVLRDLYGVDNTPFLRELRRLGFQVADSSAANYVGTLWALASILNLDYLQDLLQVDPSLTSMNPLIRLVRSNRVVHLLRGAGYRIVTLAGGYSVAEFGNPDIYLEMQGSLDEFERMLLDTTPLPWIFPHRQDPHEVHRRRLHWVLDTLPQTVDAPEPRFVFAHLLAPHPPFVVDATGEALPSWPHAYALNDGSDYMRLGGSLQEYRQAYAAQVQWVTQRVLQVVQQILAEHAQDPPVILLVSDHGPGSSLDWDSLEHTDIRERFGVLCAVSLPDGATPTLPADLPPVGLFRLVFDVCFGTDLGPLPARSYYSTRSRPYDFLDVTDLVAPREPSPR